jgi:hypothetical protein
MSARSWQRIEVPVARAVRFKARHDCREQISKLSKLNRIMNHVEVLIAGAGPIGRDLRAETRYGASLTAMLRGEVMCRRRILWK